MVLCLRLLVDPAEDQCSVPTYQTKKKKKSFCPCGVSCPILTFFGTSTQAYILKITCIHTHGYMHACQ